MRTLIIGCVLTITSWLAAWSSRGLITELSFFPLWLGYILAINGLAQVTFGTSLLTRMKSSFVRLFVISVPMWWFFEGMNVIVQNWHYQFSHPISELHYLIQASISFSTVVPAVMSTLFFFYLLQAGHRPFTHARSVNPSKSLLASSVLIGLASYVLLPLFPHETFPLVWIAPVLILEPITYAIGYPSLLRSVEKGNWALLVSAALSTTLTGICWELWNFYSTPKWTYTIPYVGFWKIFEMPFLGYFGYPVFGLVVFSYTSITMMIVWKQSILDLLPDFEARTFRSPRETGQKTSRLG